MYQKASGWIEKMEDELTLFIMKRIFGYKVLLQHSNSAGAQSRKLETIFSYFSFLLITLKRLRLRIKKFIFWKVRIVYIFCLALLPIMTHHHEHIIRHPSERTSKGWFIFYFVINDWLFERVFFCLSILDKD